MTLAVGALSACGGDDPDGDGSSTTTATPLDPSSSSSSSSGSGSSTSSSSGSGSSTSTSAKGDAPEIPAAAKEHTDEGATEFAEFYWLESGRAAHEGDTSFLKTLYTSACKPCAEYSRLVDADIAKGLRTDVQPTKVRKVDLSDTTDGKSDKAVTVTAHDVAYSLVDAKGKSEGKSKPLDYRVIIYLDWTAGAWTVVDSFMIS